MLPGARSHALAAVIVAATLGLGACANRPQNLRLTADPHEQAFDRNYVFSAYIEARSTRHAIPAYPIIVTMSGGGTRATALAADVIRELRAFARDGHPLTDDVIVVSGTSGGSFTATAFAVYANDPKGFDRFYDQFVVRQDKTGKLAGSLLVPWKWNYLATNRTAALAKLLDDRLQLNDARFAMLSDPASWGQRPFLILNSTDFGAGAPFVFNQYYFSLICSDLDQYPIALATAAAGAFPFLLSDVELENLRDAAAPCPAPPTKPPKSGPERFAAIEQLRHQRYAYDISHAFDPQAEPPSSRRNVQWLHLFDGGLVDNMGIRSAADLFTDRTMRKLVEEAPGRNIPAMLHILINARDDTPPPMDHEQGSPSWVAVAENVVFEPVDTTSDLSAWGIQNYMAELFAVASTADYPQSYRTVQIDFDLLDLSVPENRTLRDQAAGSELLTQLDITDLQRNAIEEIAHILLLGNPCFQDYVVTTNVKPPGEFDGKNSKRCAVVKPGKSSPPQPVPFLEKMEE